MQDKIFTLGFSAFPGIGTRRFEQLVSLFGSARAAWSAKDKDLLAILKKALGRKFVEFRKNFSPAVYAQELNKKKITFFTPNDRGYPKLLKKLPHPPFILFAKGNLSLLKHRKVIGVVGTIKVTNYGREVTGFLVKDLVAQDFVIVSGMALGVDGIAHQTTLNHHGHTIAVLGSGVDVPLPREHEQLYYQILENNGLIISTFSPN